jgi:hypothetical protein
VFFGFAETLLTESDTPPEYSARIPYRYGARQRWSRGAERDAEVRELCRAPNVFQGPLVQGGRTGQTTAEGADGSSACPGDSSHERGALAGATDPGTSSRPTNPSACGTQVRSCVRCPGSAWMPSRVGLGHRPCAVGFLERRAGARLASGRPRKRLLAKRSARPVGEDGQEKDRLAPGRAKNRGDDARVYTGALGCLTIE